MSLPKLYSMSEVCESMGWSESTLKRRIKEGLITPVLDEGKIKFEEEEIRKYIARRKLKAS